MAVDDHGLEAIRKAAEYVTPGDKSDYFLKTLNLGLLNVDWDEVDVTYPTSDTEVYTFKKSDVQVRVITLTYTDATKELLSNARRTS